MHSGDEEGGGEVACIRVTQEMGEWLHACGRQGRWGRGCMHTGDKGDGGVAACIVVTRETGEDKGPNC